MGQICGKASGRADPSDGALELVQQSSVRPSERATGGPSEKTMVWQPSEKANAEVTDMAALVSDLSGLTRNTRKFGVLQTASNIARMRQIALPVLHRLGMREFSTEGDNLIVTFPDIASAAQAAYELQQLWKQYDASLPADREHFKIRASGFAIAWGAAHRSGLHLVGRGFQRSYDLAEDEAEGGQILVGEVIQKLLPSVLPGASLKPVGRDDMQELVPSASMVEVFKSSLPMAGFDDDRYLPMNLVKLAMRHEPSADLAAVDAELTRRFLYEGMAAVLFRVEEDAPLSVKEEQNSRARVCFLGSPGVIRYEDIGVIPNPDLTFFDTGSNALQAVMAAVKVCDRAVVTGWGIHQGEVLLVPGTDVQLGDPINTASKIGQDLAARDEILISDAVYQGLSQDLKDSFSFEQTDYAASGVAFNPWRVQEK